jgi:hypothetical protein
MTMPFSYTLDLKKVVVVAVCREPVSASVTGKQQGM